MNTSTTTNHHHFHAIIFDHDGTLVDSEYIHCDCWNKVLAPHGHTLNFASYCALYNGLPTRETAARLQERYKLTESIDALYQHKINILNEYLTQNAFPLLPHVQVTLRFLQQNNIPLAIASGANYHEVANSVKQHNIASFFKAICTKNDVTHSKPAPDVYLLAAQQLNLEPKNCLAIEDSDTGYESARKAGMHCLRLTTQPTAEEEFKDMGAILHQLEQWLLSGQLYNDNQK
jgi:HAD superfamily hydrolase (TIGR01509 family)